MKEWGVILIFRGHGRRAAAVSILLCAAGCLNLTGFENRKDPVPFRDASSEDMADGTDADTEREDLFPDMDGGDEGDDVDVLPEDVLDVPWEHTDVLDVLWENTLFLSPNGAGEYTNILRQAPSTGEHWDKVDDPPGSPDESTYVHTQNMAQEKDAYNLQDATHIGEINFVRIYFNFRRILTSGTVYAQPFLRLGANETTGTERSESEGVSTIFSEILARPGGGGWTWADINSLQAVIGLRSGSATAVKCSQIYIEVDYH